MNGKDENTTGIDNQEEELEVSHKEATDGITCKKDLTSIFEQSDHSVNKVHFSKVCFT